MSEYQFYQFCSLSTPLSPKARDEMHSLSSRAHVTTHGATYVYNYGDFKGDEKKLLLKHFDVFFYMANWGIVELMLKYPREKIDVTEIKKYCSNGVVSCTEHDQNVVLEIRINDEDGGGGWVDGEGWLSDLLPLYDEIINKDYRLLSLTLNINRDLGYDIEETQDCEILQADLSSAQKVFLKCVGEAVVS